MSLILLPAPASSALCLLLLGLSALSVGAEQPHQPATDDSPQASGLETLLVTAHRVPTSTPTLPVIVRDLDTRPDVGTDALRDLPSFAISQAGSMGSLTQVRVRGAEANHLLVLLDGVEIMDPTTDAGFNFANLNMAGIHRLEYLPGAHSAIWGSDAVAGVLQFSTRPASTLRRVELEGGSFDSRFVRAQLAATEPDYYYNLSISDFTTDGTNISRAGKEDDGYDNRSWFASGGLDRGNWALRSLVRQGRTRSDFDPTPFPAYLPVDGDRQNRHHEDLALVGLDAVGAGGRWEEHLTLSYFKTTNSTQADGMRTESNRGERWQLTSTTRWQPHPDHAFDLLLEHKDESFEQRGEPSVFGDPNQRQDFNSNSAGIEWQAALLDTLQLAASARYDHNDQFEDSHSFRLSSRYPLTAHTSVWAAWGTGIKQPSFVERYGFTPDSFIGNPNLDSETNVHASLGIEQIWGSWQLSLTGFRDRLKDEIDGFYFDPDAGGFTAINQQGTSRRRGLELSASRPWDSGTLQLGGSYLHAEDPDGSREIRRPAWLGFARLQQRWGLASLSLDAFYVDDQDDLDFATFPATRVDLNSYTLLNAQLSLQLPHRMDIGVRIANLLDERYEDQLGYEAPGRAVYLSMGLDL